MSEDRDSRQEQTQGAPTVERGEQLTKEVKEKLVPQEPQRKLYGTFAGVFTPTLLTILGVIMFLREGWVVGNAGLLGAWLIILLSFGITSCTGLSLSSITTNIRIGAGGAFNIISQSLGLEVGGSIGIPLYISQALAVAMYIFGFRAGWLWVFPDHPALLVDLGVFLVLFGIAYVSAGLAFRVQYAILVIIVGALVSVGWAAAAGSMQHSIQWWGDFPGSPENAFKGIGFWAVFAVFFPASTGIMAGANMSGELANPRKSIPLGTMSAIGLSLLIYMLLAWWLASSATVDELTGNYTVMIDKSAWGPAVLLGLLGATFSSALASIVGAPRILQAMGEHKIVPFAGFFAARTSSGEPRNAMIITGALVVGALMLRDLNAVAPLITMFFLITYAMINIVVLIEQNLRLVSFRPLFRIPKTVSFFGAVGCVFAMFIVNLPFGLAAAAVVVAIHTWLVRRHLRAPFGDVRSGLMVALAEWAAKKMEELSGPTERTWKANMLVPVEVAAQARDYFSLLQSISYPKGFIRLLGLTGKREIEDLEQSLPELAEQFRDQNVFCSWTVVNAATFSDNLSAGMEALGGAFFTSNMLFLPLPGKDGRREEVARIIRSASQQNMGVLLYVGAPADIPEKGRNIAVFMDRPGKDWEPGMDLGNNDLALLTAYKLKRNWKADLHLVARVQDPVQQEAARDFMRSVVELGRIPNAHVRVQKPGGEAETVRDVAPDLAVFPFDADTPFEDMERLRHDVGVPCLFAMDSGRENALV